MIEKGEISACSIVHEVVVLEFVHTVSNRDRVLEGLASVDDVTDETPENALQFIGQFLCLTLLRHISILIWESVKWVDHLVNLLSSQSDESNKRLDSMVFQRLGDETILSLIEYLSNDVLEALRMGSRVPLGGSGVPSANRC